MRFLYIIIILFTVMIGCEKEENFPAPNIPVDNNTEGYRMLLMGNSFSVDSYHYFDIQDGQIIASGDYFDATGMVMAVSAQSAQE